MATILLSVAVVGIAFTLISLRILLVDGGEFAGTCSTRNPMLNAEHRQCLGCKLKLKKHCPNKNPDAEVSIPF